MLAISSVAGNDQAWLPLHDDVCHFNIMRGSAGLSETDVFDCYANLQLQCL